jgi:hypothetical protein
METVLEQALPVSSSKVGAFWSWRSPPTGPLLQLRLLVTTCFPRMPQLPTRPKARAADGFGRQLADSETNPRDLHAKIIYQAPGQKLSKGRETENDLSARKVAQHMLLRPAGVLLASLRLGGTPPARAAAPVSGTHQLAKGRSEHVERALPPEGLGSAHARTLSALRSTSVVIRAVFTAV